MAPGPEPSASLVRRGCAIRERSPSSRARPRPFHACCATPTRNMTDEQSYDPAEAPAAVDPSEAPAQETSEVEALKRERDDLYDRLLRKSAEFDNYRKRVERERRELADQSVTDLLLDLLAVADDFDRALTVDAGEGAVAY